MFSLGFFGVFATFVLMEQVESGKELFWRYSTGCFDNFNLLIVALLFMLVLF